MGMTSTSAVMPCCPQKSSISWVSAIPPIGDPERLRRAHDQAERRDGERLLRRAHHGKVAIAAQQIDVRIDVVIGGDSIENEVKAAGVLLHLVRILRDDDLI